MRVLLDTHVVMWALAGSPRLSTRAGLCMLDVTIRHAAAVERIRAPHADPFDRLLLAQCEVETMRLMTADKVLARLPVAIAC